MQPPSGLFWWPYLAVRTWKELSSKDDLWRHLCDGERLRDVRHENSDMMFSTKTSPLNTRMLSMTF